MAADPEVQRLQIALSRLGHRPGRLDGLWGRRTAEATVEAALALGIPRGLTAGLIAAVVDRVEEARAGVRVLSRSEFAALFPRSIHPASGEARAAARVEGVLTPRRAAAFLAQLGHESAGLRYFEEIASGSAYEGRRDLGNTQPGDGRRFKGRGPIQLTGRANYRRFGSLLGIDLENDPAIAALPDVGFRVAIMYWTDRNLNYSADHGDFEGITRAINGGLNGYRDRQNWWIKTKAIFEV